jgi:hypothetical protein
MAWNTAKMQDLRSLGAAPKRRDTAGIDRAMRSDAHRGSEQRGIFRFPIELYLEQLLPSWASPKIQLMEALNLRWRCWKRHVL